MAAHDPAQVTDSVQRMYRFLLQSEELRGSPVRDLDGARVLWLGDLPSGSDSIVSGLLPEGPADTWLTADRVLRDAPPAPSPLLEPWLDPEQVRDHTRAEPPVLLPVPRTEPEESEGGPEPLPLAEHPDRDAVRSEHTDWSRHWNPWAEAERATAPFARIYEDVFRIQQEFTELGDAHELVLAVGYLTWTAEGRPVRRHLVTRRLVPAMDETGRVEFAVDPDAPGFALEEDMLEASQRMGEASRERIRDHLAAAAEYPGPDGAQHLHAALREWAASAEAGAHYDEAAARHTASAYSDSARVSFAPALVLRPRPRRGQVNALREIVDTVERRGADTALLRLVTGTGSSSQAGPPAEAADGEEARARAVPEPEELYFSLPSNAEQRRIAQRLRDSELVVVQGPPGTGKTHTIANLVTDLLANGKRILITSQTTRALRVLKDKLPEQIKPLAVSRTGDGLEAQRELEGSVRAILERQADHEPARADAEIDKLRNRLDKAVTKRNGALRDLRAIRERETYRHPREIGDYQGTLTAIARRLAHEEDRRSWIGEVGSEQPAVSSDQALALLAAARAYTPGHRAVAAAVPEAADLSAPSRYADALAAIDRAERAAARASDSWGGDLDDLLQGLSRERCTDLRARVDAFTTRRDAAARLDPRWSAQHAAVLAGRERETVLQEQTGRSFLGKAEEELDRIREVRVDGLESFPLTEAMRHATALREGFEAGRKLSGPFGMRTRLFKDNAAFVTGITVDGSALDTEPEVRAVGHRVEAERHLCQAEAALGVTGVPVWQDPSLRLVRLRDHLDDLGLLLELARERVETVRATADLPRLAGVDWADSERVDSIALILAAVDAGHAAAPARRLVDDVLATLRGWADRPEPEPGALRRARTAVEAADPEAYADACIELEEVREAARLRDTYEAARALVHEGHTTLAERISQDPHDACWDGRLADIEGAWAWSVWNRRLVDLTDPAAEERCRGRLGAADREAASALAALAAARAWRECLGRLTHDQEVALSSYQQSVRRIGKGTGKYAARHQNQARESLRECQPAIPAWIMPLHQVVATVPMDTPDVFDVVIVDEASQSGPDALLLAWLGRKLVVVGDDKQVSPRNVGLDQQEVFTLQQRHLGAFPASRRNLFAPNNSLFDIAAALAGSRGKLMLREHFRCMPEIIGFSNEQFYQGRLQPLRQYAADRLPPLRTVHVRDGMLEDRGQKQVNRAEAALLVDHLVRCCEDPAYTDRTMGVVTLAGTAQQALIEEMLSERLPLDTRVERRVRVGNPGAFQGDERDVMFLSAVYAPFDTDGEPRRPAPFSSVPDQQAVNVAASRARDQVWFFHSFAMSDLGSTDLRRHYLDYLERPAAEQDGTGIGHVPADERVDPFDSVFEQRVYLALRERGYWVIPQFPAGPYRIDLVVEGGTRRLAVECDGDAFHTEENAADDADRQRELERVGWTFVRVRGSRFFRDPETALQPLWKRLEEMEIAPVGL